MIKLAKHYLRIANALEQKDPKAADIMERIATSISMYVPSQMLEQIYRQIGGNLGSGEILGGLHIKLSPTRIVVNNPQTIVAARELIRYFPNQIPEHAFQQVSQKYKTDIKELGALLGALRQAYDLGIRNENMMFQYALSPAPIDLQLAAADPAAKFYEMGLSQYDIMQHELAHQMRTTATKEYIISMAKQRCMPQILNYFKNKVLQDHKQINDSNILSSQEFQQFADHIVDQALRYYMGSQERYNDPDELGASANHFINKGCQAILSKMLV